MKFSVLTLFPEMFEAVKQSVIKRAIDKKLIELNLVNIRSFSKDKHNKVDDTPYGGGAGMVMMPDVVYRAYERADDRIWNRACGNRKDVSGNGDGGRFF